MLRAAPHGHTMAALAGGSLRQRVTSYRPPQRHPYPPTRPKPRIRGAFPFPEDGIPQTAAIRRQQQTEQMK